MPEVPTGAEMLQPVELEPGDDVQEIDRGPKDLETLWAADADFDAFFNAFFDTGFFVTGFFVTWLFVTSDDVFFLLNRLFLHL